MAFLLMVVLLCMNVHVNGQFVQGGYDSYRSSRILFNKQHAPWNIKVPFPNDGTNGVEETVFDTVRGKSYTQYSFKPFTLLEIDMTSGKSNFIHVTIPNFEKYDGFVGISSARLDSKGNYFATILLSGDDSLIVRVDLSNRIGQVSHFERTNIYTSVLAETQNFYIIGTSPPSILGLDATTLQLKWTANVTGSEMILVNSANSKDDVIYAADYNILHKILVNDGRIISSFKFPHDIDNIAYVSGVNGWVSVTLANDTSISVSFLNIENQIEARLEVMSTRHMPHVDSNSACSYPIATANQTGNILEITSIVKCEITSGFGGSEKIIAVKSRFDKNSLKPLPNEPNLIWSTDTSALVIAQIDSKTILSMEYSAENSIYIQYDISTGKIIKTSPSRISSGYGFPYLVTSSNNKVYRYELTPHIDVESADL